MSTHWADGRWVKYPRADFRAGWWYSVCCYLDLYEAKTDREAAAELASEDEFWESDGFGSGLMWWPTEEEALNDLMVGESRDRVVSELREIEADTPEDAARWTRRRQIIEAL